MKYDSFLQCCKTYDKAKKAVEVAERNGSSASVVNRKWRAYFEAEDAMKCSEWYDC